MNSFRLPFHPISHRKLPETLTPVVPLTTLSMRKKNTHQPNKKSICTSVCAFGCCVRTANDHLHITATGCIVYVIAYPIHMHTQWRSRRWVRSTNVHTHTAHHTPCSWTHSLWSYSRIFAAAAATVATTSEHRQQQASQRNGSTETWFYSGSHINWIIARIVCICDGRNMPEFGTRKNNWKKRS